MIDDIRICEGISDLSDSYNGFLIDQWGTLHDGEKPYAAAIEALEDLKKRGKQIILISNSGKRAEPNHKRLIEMGFPKGLFDHVVTSAETTWQNLQNRSEGLFKGLGDTCFLMNRDGETSVTDGIDGLNVTDNMEEANFILLTGSDIPNKSMGDYYLSLLKVGAKRQLKMICANPEKTVTIKGKAYLGSGEIARRYEEIGGVVTYIGKPFPLIFQYAMSLFRDVLPSQVVVVGDSLPNDMRGAKYLDMDCALIAGGIHHGSFSKVQSRADIQKMLAILGKNYGVYPNYFVPRFHWGKALPDRKNRRKRTK